MVAEQNKSVLCYKCNADTEFNVDSKIHRSDECPKCFASLHCCNMCSFFDKTAYNECREPMANRVLDKEKANFCEFFKLGGSGNGGTSNDDILSAANALFKD